MAARSSSDRVSDGSRPVSWVPVFIGHGGALFAKVVFLRVKEIVR
jgi:hypothetical protein